MEREILQLVEDLDENQQGGRDVEQIIESAQCFVAPGTQLYWTGPIAKQSAIDYGRARSAMEAQRFACSNRTDRLSVVEI